jgi:hypothetical protein
MVDARRTDGGIVANIPEFKDSVNPSVSFADSSLYTREPFGSAAYKYRVLTVGGFFGTLNPQAISPAGWMYAITSW